MLSNKMQSQRNLWNLTETTLVPEISFVGVNIHLFFSAWFCFVLCCVTFHFAALLATLQMLQSHTN